MREGVDDGGGTTFHGTREGPSDVFNGQNFQNSLEGYHRGYGDNFICPLVHIKREFRSY